jgi:shikimate dehydrogenase
MNQLDTLVGDVRHLAAVIGSPISHSLSPVLHNAAYRELGLEDWRYVKKEVTGVGLRGFIGSLDSRWAGLSLTMPLKKEILRYGIPSDEWSKKLGVANTAVFDWGSGEGDRESTASLPHIFLFNTDVIGIQQALLRQMGSSEHVPSSRLRVKRGIILGSGSTALSAAAALCSIGVEEVVVLARHPQKAGEVIDFLAREGTPARVGELDSDEIFNAIEGDARNAADCARSDSSFSAVVSTLPPGVCDQWAVGLGEKFSGRSISKCILFLDVAYGSKPSQFVEEWGRLGGNAADGRQVLLWQAVKQVSLMTHVSDEDVPIAAMCDSLCAPYRIE